MGESTPNDELRELIEEWRSQGQGMQAVATQSDKGELYVQGKTMELKADELEELVNNALE